MNKVLHNLAALQHQLEDAGKALVPAVEKAMREAASAVARNATDLANADPQASAGLRQSIVSDSAGMEATVGSTDSAAPGLEFGTASTPPRPFLTQAAIESQEEIRKIAGEAVLGVFTAR